MSLIYLVKIRKKIGLHKSFLKKVWKIGKFFIGNQPVTYRKNRNMGQKNNPLVINEL